MPAESHNTNAHTSPRVIEEDVHQLSVFPVSPCEVMIQRSSVLKDLNDLNDLSFWIQDAGKERQRRRKRDRMQGRRDEMRGERRGCREGEIRGFREGMIFSDSSVS